MSTPAVAEGRIGGDAGDNYMNLSSNVRSATAGDSSARTSAMSTSSSRRGRSNVARVSQVTEQSVENDAGDAQNAVSSTSGAIENTPDNGHGVPVPAEDMNLHRTLTPLMRIKLSELTTSSSDSEGEEVHQGTAEDGAAGNGDSRRAVSPPPNCAICLGRCKNKCFTDSCMHQFCFKCLCEWSKVKPECPLCKQTFKSIIHNVKSIDQFEEYHVQPPTVQIPHRPMEVTIRSLPYIFDAVVVEGHDWELPRRRNSAHRIRPASSGIFYPSEASANGEHGSSSNGASMYNHLVYRNELLDMYRQEAPDAIATSGTLSQLWRRFIYDRRLFALPVCDITGRFRESTARFYRDNPAQVHRLMPWINRDIVCLLRNTEHDVSSLLERINESLLQTNILSPAFRRRLQPYLGTKTSHFIHELNNFARSPYDMIGYDRAVHYLPQAPEEIVIEFSSSASSDDENASNDNERSTRSRNSRVRNDGEFRVLSRSGNSSVSGSVGALLSFTVSTTSEGTEAPGVTVSINGRSGQSAAINLSTHNRVSSDIIDLDDSEVPYEGATSRATNDPGSSTSAAAPTSANEEMASTSAAANRPLPTVTENIELTSSSSDECEFVLERKPPHLRTPELVSLNSESDSDVVFVEESKPRRKSTYLSSAAEDQEECENSNKKSTNQNPTVAEGSAQASADREELYNIGASTSTGLRSSGAGRGIKEMYERSRRSVSTRRKRNLRSNRANDEAQAKTSTTVHRGKRIYESSCTSSYSSSCTSDSDDEDFSVQRQRSKSRRTSKRAKPTRSRRKVATQQNNRRGNSRGRNSTSSRKRKVSSSTNKQQSEDAKRFKVEARSSDSEYSSDDSQSLIQLQRRLQALKDREKQGATLENIDKTLSYLIECDRDNESSISTANANNSTDQMPTGSQQLENVMQADEFQDLKPMTKQENFDSESQNENSVPSDCGRQRLFEAAEESLDVAQNVCPTSTNECEVAAANIAIEEENTFSSTVTQTTTATTVTTTPANNRSISRASATTNNTNDNDNDNGNENCNDNDNYNTSETSSTSSSSTDTSVSSPSLFSASSGGEEEDGDDNDRNNDDNDEDGNSLGLQQLLDSASLGDAWLVHQLGNSGADNEMEVSTAQHANDDENGSNDRSDLSPQHVEEEALSLPDIENDVGGIFLNQHDSSLVLPFNYDAEGSQSDNE
ncbi:PREDICTED: E3 ubiquitin-protein ligase Topors-like [Rhagoletis zephyria]|uniref:E3 ubiquitin-protein ligase Topors-like n=1 Tax=Rhagoletis zephyria TaxID=28612 RepID=UPI0008119D8B|nr:PREDICTED: E3 ubiquitin-protein ligase Topors-like [Rhagoletis zephyria]